MDLQSLLGSRSLIVGDGAMGSQLMAHGLAAGECGEGWNLENPGAVQRNQRAYVEAGADFLLTNTFGGNSLALERHGLSEKVEEINRSGAEIAFRAADGEALVFGDVGPTGGLLEPLGELSEREVREAFAPQVQALAEAGVHAIICETFESGAELALALEAARECCDLPLIASMKFTAEQGGRYRSMMGEGPEQLVEVAREADCAVVGTNCGQGIKTMPRLIVALAEKLDEGTPIICQPNAGLPALKSGSTVYPEDASIFASYVPKLHDAGARLIGGCCGTTPEHVAAIRRYADCCAERQE